jgi:hypothetical protein
MVFVVLYSTHAAHIFRIVNHTTLKEVLLPAQAKLNAHARARCVAAGPLFTYAIHTEHG